MKRWLERSLLAGALSLLACDGGGHDPVDGGPEDPGPVDTQPSSDLERYTRGVCELLAQCPSAPDGASVEQCMASLSATFCGPGYETLVIPGLDACLEALSAPWPASGASARRALPAARAATATPATGPATASPASSARPTRATV